VPSSLAFFGFQFWRRSSDALAWQLVLLEDSFVTSTVQKAECDQRLGERIISAEATQSGGSSIIADPVPKLQRFCKRLRRRAGHLLEFRRGLDSVPGQKSSVGKDRMHVGIRATSDLLSDFPVDAR
jgi:hypothetical protein